MQYQFKSSHLLENNCEHRNEISELAAAQKRNYVRFLEVKNIQITDNCCCCWLTNQLGLCSHNRSIIFAIIVLANEIMTMHYNTIWYKVLLGHQALTFVVSHLVENRSRKRQPTDKLSTNGIIGERKINLHAFYWVQKLLSVVRAVVRQNNVWTSF